MRNVLSWLGWNVAGFVAGCFVAAAGSYVVQFLGGVL